MGTLHDLNATFIEGGKGPLFTLHHAPQKQNEHSECIVVSPSFAEEMNRCRYMQTMLAQALTARGYGLVSVDLYGTGDSAGEFGEASWQGWIEDTIAATHYATQLGYQNISLLGVRLGALLGMAAAPSIENLKSLILWQPVSSGKATLTQFLRLKIASAMARGETGITTAQLEEEINRGLSIQIAGYDVSPDLFSGINTAHLSHHLHFTSTPVSWFTIVPSTEKKTPRVDIQTIEKWRSNGADIAHQAIVGPAFWQAHERSLAPDLIPATIATITNSEAIKGPAK
jgi:exosortase A-associated hydrolase 2